MWFKPAFAADRFQLHNPLPGPAMALVRVPEVLLHSAGAASPGAALLVGYILPGMRPPRALRAGRIAALGVNRTSGTRVSGAAGALFTVDVHL